MKKLITILSLFLSTVYFSQSDFNIELYQQFLEENKNLTFSEIVNHHAPVNKYFSSLADKTTLDEFSYLDSIKMKYDLTSDELSLLSQNNFTISERLSYQNFTDAIMDIYEKDLPLFISTDLILHTLHSSYDQILKQLEIENIEPKLKILLNTLYADFSQIKTKYESNSELQNALQDVDLYITIAKSLLDSVLFAPQHTSIDNVNRVWEAIQNEEYIEMPLFSERNRKLDFSQFTPRGHYADPDDLWFFGKSLVPYFKCMMWLGRIDFLLTAPPENPFEEPWNIEDLRRMNIAAVMLNELINIAGVRSNIDEIDEIITFMVGKSDNLTPNELDNIIKNQEIPHADELLNDSVLINFQNALLTSSESGQKILSSIFIADPFNPKPGTLPISFRLMGQRFIVDSYILSNLVYDKIVYNNQKVWRPMPDPLDAMFVLGNDNALPLLEDELSTFNYSPQIAAQRFLIDSYDAEFWNQSLYNTWLQAIRFLNPVIANTEHPDFMKTVAWQQEKLNTQLASWTQLRHDNLLYAKQSSTLAGGCIFPHTFVEPYPEFYGQIEIFAQNAENFFSEIGVNEWIVGYFKNFKVIMNKLKSISIKEINKEVFNNDEVKFLSSVLDSVENSCGLWVSGWYGQLYYDGSKMTDEDFLIADVHTQPTDQYGAAVGKILHVGVGKVNLGVFLTESPSDEFKPTAYVGPVMSYYEKIEDDFKRLTDEEWFTIVVNNNLPQRPDWHNIFLADLEGNLYPKGRELSGEYITGVIGTKETIQKRFFLSQNYPNPFNPSTVIQYQIPYTVDALSPDKVGIEVQVSLKVFDILGREVETLVNEKQKPGNYEVEWDASNYTSGIYFYQLKCGYYNETRKMILIQ